MTRRQMTLEEILTPAQLKELQKTMNQLEKEGISPEEVEYTNRLKALFRPWEKDLHAKEIVPDYLAYVVVYMLWQGKQL